LGNIAQAVGDDCALIPDGGGFLAFSTDLFIEGTHFRPGWLDHHELGWRAAAAALSDLAAVAASPLGVLASVGVSPEWPDDFVADLMEGVGAAAHSVGAAVWGGDLVRSDRLVVDVTVVGRAERPVRRSGAAAGTVLWATGALGGPQAALEAWQAGNEPDRDARARFAHPVPRVEEARWLADRGALAMIDLSDGLLADASHLAAASGVEIRIEREHVPVHATARDVEQALTSGEEYELLVAMPADFDWHEEFGERFGILLTRVGTVGEVREEGGGKVGEGWGRVVVLDGGRPVEMPPGFRHF
jgi:thiamine-monophosphate kinase